MSLPFDCIVAIYNPNSTNDAKDKAESLRDEAATHDIKIKLVPTDHPGHAAEIAKDVVASHTSPLLISVSGDGGYNELINGVTGATIHTKKKQPTVAILAAGNANDHKRSTRGDTPLIELIRKGVPRPLDLLRVQAGTLDRYAHSYIGFGITPEVGVQLNKHELNRINEVTLVFRSLARFQPFRIKRQNSITSYSNLIFANISGMSKVIKLDTTGNKLRDGKFEVIADEWHGRWRLVFHLLKLVVVGHRHAPKFEQYTFETVDLETLVQLDGEVEKIPAKTSVHVTAERGAVLSLY